MGGEVTDFDDGSCTVVSPDGDDSLGAFSRRDVTGQPEGR
ncbi:hypothetical protein ATH50_0389 [Haloplanus aerogenes]|uniref:Uncharacterized protein n=1 Tax=Haloplanus aerogenes TaxID=660522 RepID=A0A3M0E0T5_9EURY|nr:hypothetical protein ATH50_0389 [Haloplanus aerogenes]